MYYNIIIFTCCEYCYIIVITNGNYPRCVYDIGYLGRNVHVYIWFTCLAIVFVTLLEAYSKPHLIILEKIPQTKILDSAEKCVSICTSLVAQICVLVFSLSNAITY